MNHHLSKSDECLNRGYHVKILKTLTALLFKPGFLSKEFNSGKREGYISPVKLYIAVSIIFFFLMNLVYGIINDSKDKEKEMKERNSSGITFKIGGISSRQLKRLNENQLDSLIMKHKPNSTKFERYRYVQLQRIANGEGRKLAYTLGRNFSYSLFFLMPLFGWFAFLFHIRKYHRYSDFLIFSIHFHSFTFLLGSILILLSFIYSSKIAYTIAIILTIIYLCLALKNVFPQRMLSALIKSISLLAFYEITVVAFFAGIVMLSIYLF